MQYKFLNYIKDKINKFKKLVGNFFKLCKHAILIRREINRQFLLGCKIISSKKLLLPVFIVFDNNLIQSLIKSNIAFHENKLLSMGNGDYNIDNIIKWHFSDTVIFLEVARLNLDKDLYAWRSVLKLLRKHDKLLAYKGILVSMSSTNEEHNKNLEILRAQISQIYFTLAQILPIYFFIIDSLKIPLFHYLSGINKAISIDLSGNSDANRNNERLYLDLQQLRLKITRSNADKVDELILLPDLMLDAFEQCMQKLKYLTIENPYYNALCINKIYFIDESASNLINSAIKDLLSSKFTVCQLPMYIKKEVLKYRYLKWSVFVGAILLPLWFFNVCYHNFALGQETEKKLAKFYSANNTNIIEQLELQMDLLEARNKLNSNMFYEILCLGLNKGNKYCEFVDTFLIKYLYKNYLVLAINRIEEKLSEFDARWNNSSVESKEQLRTDYYFILKSYLQFHMPQYIDSDAIMQYLRHSGCDSMHDDRLLYLSKLYASLIKNNESLFSKINRVNFNEALVKKSQQNLLLSQNNAIFKYNYLKAKLGKKLGEITINEIINTRHSSVLRSKSMLKLFTLSGWDALSRELKYLHDEENTDWVLVKYNNYVHDSKDNDELRQLIRKLYIRDYLSTWLELLSNVIIVKTNNLQDLSNRLEHLTSDDGELCLLAKNALRHLEVIEQYQYDLEVEQKVILNKIKELFSMQDKSKWQAYMVAINNIKTEIDSLAVRPNRAQEIKEYAKAALKFGKFDDAGLAISKAYLYVNSLSQELQDPKASMALNKLLLAPLTATWYTVTYENLLQIENTWQGQVLPVLLQAVSKFPLDSQSPNDISLQEIIDIFHPTEGVIMRFMHEQAEPFIVLNNNEWNNIYWLASDLGFNQNFMQLLNYAYKFSQLFFNSGSEPGFKLKIYPMPNAALQELNLTFHGQNFRYRNEPQEWREYSWPGDLSKDYATMSITDKEGENKVIGEMQGLWALFHLLNSAEVKFEQNSKAYFIKWRHKLGIAGFKIRSQGKFDLFELLKSPFKAINNIYDK